MTDTEYEQVNRMIVILGKLQSVLHDVDKMLETPVKHEFKNRFTNFQSYLERKLEETTSLFNYEASETFIDFTIKLDVISDSFRLLIKETQEQDE